MSGVQRLCFVTLQPLEKVIQHRFGLRGQRLEVLGRLVEQVFGSRIARLSISILASKLLRMRFQCLVGQLFKGFAKESVCEYPAVISLNSATSGAAA